MDRQNVVTCAKQARAYLQKRGYYRNFSQENTTQIFLENLSKYLYGQVNREFMVALADQMLYTIFRLRQKTPLGKPLFRALAAASNLELLSLDPVKLSRTHEHLKHFVQQNHQASSVKPL